MNPAGELRAEWAAKLIAAAYPELDGFTITTDPNALVPFVLFDAITFGPAAGIGAWTATLPVVVGVAPPGDGPALGVLEAATVAVLRAFPAPTSAVPGTYGAKDHPAYVVTYPVQIPNPDC